MALRATKGDENLARAHVSSGIWMQPTAGKSRSWEEPRARFSTVPHGAKCFNINIGGWRSLRHNCFAGWHCESRFVLEVDALALHHQRPLLHVRVDGTDILA